MTLTIALALAGAVAGIVAAVYWLQASRVKRHHFVDDIVSFDGQPIAPEDSDRLWALLDAVDKSGKLNAWAAGWTAASVILNAASAIASAVHR